MTRRRPPARGGRPVYRSFHDHVYHVWSSDPRSGTVSALVGVWARSAVFQKRQNSLFKRLPLFLISNWSPRNMMNSKTWIDTTCQTCKQTLRGPLGASSHSELSIVTTFLQQGWSPTRDSEIFKRTNDRFINLRVRLHSYGSKKCSK